MYTWKQNKVHLTAAISRLVNNYSVSSGVPVKTTIALVREILSNIERENENDRTTKRTE